jgi:hypothetical protein
VLATIPVKARRRDGPVARELTFDPDILELARRVYFRHAGNPAAGH